MNVQAHQTLERICEEPAFRVELLTPLKTIGEFTDELLSSIEQATREKRWGCLCRLIWVAQRFPSRRLVPLLSNLLIANEDDTYLEALVDALAIVPDERAIDALTSALSYRLPGDDLSFHFNKKVIGALSSIGSEKALMAIRQALQSPEETIRNFASEALARLE